MKSVPTEWAEVGRNAKWAQNTRLAVSISWKNTAQIARRGRVKSARSSPRPSRKFEHKFEAPFSTGNASNFIDTGYATVVTSISDHPPRSLTCVFFAKPSFLGVAEPFLTQNGLCTTGLRKTAQKNGIPLVERPFFA
jgi:hypothetical protein